MTNSLALRAEFPPLTSSGLLKKKSRAYTATKFSWMFVKMPKCRLEACPAQRRSAFRTSRMRI